jgi:hypothetical protein
MFAQAFEQAKKTAEEFKKLMQEIEKEDAGEKIAETFANAQAQMAVAADSFERSMAKIKSAQDDVTTATESVVKGIDAEFASLNKLNEAKMKAQEIDIQNDSSKTHEQKAMEIELLHEKDAAKRKEIQKRMDDAKEAALKKGIADAAAASASSQAQIPQAQSDAERTKLHEESNKKFIEAQKNRLEQINKRDEELREKWIDNPDIDESSKLGAKMAPGTGSPEAKRYAAALAEVQAHEVERQTIEKSLGRLGSPANAIKEAKETAAAEAKLKDLQAKAEKAEKDKAKLEKELAALNEKMNPTTATGRATRANETEEERVRRVAEQSAAGLKIAQDAEKTSTKTREMEQTEDDIKHHTGKTTPEVIAKLKADLAESQREKDALLVAMQQFKDADDLSKKAMAQALKDLAAHSTQLQGDIKTAVHDLPRSRGSVTAE